MEFLRSAVEMVGRMSSAIEREIYGNKAAAAAGITGAAFAQEVERWRKRQSWQARKKAERRDLLPSVSRQPRSRELRYENIRSGLAEEGILRLVLMDPALFSAADISPELFTSPTLGKAFRLLRDRHDRALSVQLPALAGEFTTEEMSLLVEATNQPESMANAGQAMRDYIKTIRTEAQQRQEGKDNDALLALRNRRRETMMEDGQ